MSIKKRKWKQRDFNHSPFEGPLPVATYMIFLSNITSGIDTLSDTNFDSISLSKTAFCFQPAVLRTRPYGFL
jgi:hypothetical protein